MAIASLVLGIVGIFTCGLCGVGSIVGLVLGVMGVVKDRSRGMAIAGVVLNGLALILSIIGLVFAIPLAEWFFATVGECSDRTKYPTSEDQQRCIENLMPFLTPTPGPQAP
ncbi:DUF4190 domain-containing protein [Rhizohabitans arisaemae]|uniref:DUF4190 domain-containing protein n=1 Tax=Rhizohabitans arisaemae TaxID=2720610 RepID=UPI0024B0B37A|nr:DUF4190 domain-containing protein [Rhizohabitans arisaemae]